MSHQFDNRDTKTNRILSQTDYQQVLPMLNPPGSFVVFMPQGMLRTTVENKTGKRKVVQTAREMKADGRSKKLTYWTEFQPYGMFVVIRNLSGQLMVCAKSEVLNYVSA